MRDAPRSATERVRQISRLGRALHPPTAAARRAAQELPPDQIASSQIGRRLGSADLSVENS